MPYESLNGTIEISNGSHSSLGPLPLSKSSGESESLEDSDDGGGNSKPFVLDEIAKTSIDTGNHVDSETGDEITDDEGLELNDLGGPSRRGSHTSAQTFMLYTPDEEHFLDRSNVGNARIAGLSRDLELDSGQYEWLLRAFYITYITFEWSEAAFGPGVPFYLSFFYKRDELALRTGLFISAAPLATSFAASLAWLITKISDYVPIAAWRMLFLVEGFPSVIVAIFAWHCLPDSPNTAVYLTKRQKRVATLRLRKERDPSYAAQAGRGVKWTEIMEALADPKNYVTAARDPSLTRLYRLTEYLGNVFLLQCSVQFIAGILADNN
ncbi:MAG: hypothetical protein Q9191_000868 [Dirinaria sp. TL-2023a]